MPPKNKASLRAFLCLKRRRNTPLRSVGHWLNTIISGPRKLEATEKLHRLFRIDVSRSPAAAAPVENTPGRNGDWASRQMLDSFPFVFAWKPVKVKLQADCWLRLELITMKRNTISCEKTWNTRGWKYRKMVYSLLSFLTWRKASYGLETTV